MVLLCSENIHFFVLFKKHRINNFFSMKVKRGLPKLPSSHYTRSCQHLDSQNMRNVNNHLKISNANSKWSEEKKKGRASHLKIKVGNSSERHIGSLSSQFNQNGFNFEKNLRRLRLLFYSVWRFVLSALILIDRCFLLRLSKFRRMKSSVT